jgi:hypothetical protein
LLLFLQNHIYNKHLEPVIMRAGFASSVTAAGVAVVSEVTEATCAFVKRPGNGG